MAKARRRTTDGPPAWIDFGGRRFYRMPSGYYCSRDGRQPRRLHIAIWEDANGRPIPRGYIIHHEDHDRSNNDPSNLRLTTRAEHNSHHNLGVERGPEQRERIRAGVQDSWNRREPRELTCEFCGEKFKTRSTRTTVRFCSRRCEKLGRRIQQRESSFRPGYRPCDECGNDFTPKDGRSHLCSKPCADTWYARRKREASRARRCLRPDG
jgi:hypothetical protein